MSKAIKDVINERKRQIEKEGYSTEHDDEHEDFELTRAAICYAEGAAYFHDDASEEYVHIPVSVHWPWESAAFKPKSPRRDLVRAASLIISEIERIDRIETEK